MNHYVKIALVLCACVALTSSQFYGFSDFATSFGAPSYSSFAAAQRDPRLTQVRCFSPSPSGDPGQTSGVRVGASGFGFVPLAAKVRQFQDSTTDDSTQKIEKLAEISRQFQISRQCL